MKKITFVNENEPYLSAENLNQMQDNIETAINGVVKSGSNENGSYIKFADGTLICNGTIIKNTTIQNAIGSLYRSETISFNNFSIAFTELKDISFNLKTAPSAFVWISFYGDFPPSLTNVGRVSLISPTSVDYSYDYIITYTAIGKWK